jgi:hypothetical protein
MRYSPNVVGGWLLTLCVVSGRVMLGEPQRTWGRMSVSENYETRQAQLDSLGPTESKVTEVFTADRDGLIANVVYTPAGDIQAHWDRPRFINLNVGPTDGPDEGRYVADASAQGEDFYLPANMSQNATLSWINRLHFRRGEVLFWRSFVLPSTPGIPDSGGTVEVVFEPRSVPEVAGGERDWSAYVPDYWQDRTLWLEYMERDPSKLPRSGGKMHRGDFTGVFVDATETGLVLDVKTDRLGIASRQHTFLYRRISRVRLVY